MACDILLIRHARHAELGQVLSGRRQCAGLDAEGRRDAERLSGALAALPIGRVEASPVTRAQETAAQIAVSHGLPVETCAALDEIDFGAWAGQRFEALERDPEWTGWNRRRAEGACPAGETMRAVQARVLAHIDDCARAYPGGTVAMVTHCDIIRAAIAGVLGFSLDHIHRLVADPASVTHLRHDGGPVLVGLNRVAT
ncbi:histidine phosphatase family protein [Sphingomonas sp.]|uniref:histidine phosphatase family protein n=1 Tax=Sphingomonas sp. TaxID=28214 RepID=UPI002C6A1620|nr:histidine phosphatase family protein [Sphingomonas sp.]HTG38928.1 histidine phosphatase family protein [Sphingomonas sp.]